MDILDEPPTLSSLLHELQGQTTSQWYQFGLALGVPKEILEQLTNYSEEDCIVELLDYWLRHHPGQPTWQEVADAQKHAESYQPVAEDTANDGEHMGMHV